MFSHKPGGCGFFLECIFDELGHKILLLYLLPLSRSTTLSLFDCLHDCWSSQPGAILKSGNTSLPSKALPTLSANSLRRQHRPPSLKTEAPTKTRCEPKLQHSQTASKHSNAFARAATGLLKCFPTSPSGSEVFLEFF